MARKHFWLVTSDDFNPLLCDERMQSFTMNTNKSKINSQVNKEVWRTGTWEFLFLTFGTSMVHLFSQTWDENQPFMRNSHWGEAISIINNETITNFMETIRNYTTLYRHHDTDFLCQTINLHLLLTNDIPLLQFFKVSQKLLLNH